MHNLLAWQEHLPTLFAMKAAGELRYVGITTSDGRRHDEIEKIMRGQPLDFVQVTYSAVDREVEARILPLARERGIAVVFNRPFREGRSSARLKRAAAARLGRARSTAPTGPQFLLNFVVSHPAVTCAIPATTKRRARARKHGRVPTAACRTRRCAGGWPRHVEQL